ncbi:type 3 dihydrofolate reductase [Bowmanella sp. JS7-9]|uniref:Dihydrofolate reductase n=1 Tax=Pseudobowmanella zhangzhouensis TaxID=1537679 RepID=A0ABW1XMC4_9ALTE|nr:type 3 dihydrofolate reductase [Bowmanella sp. JS7-9]TBX22004.1 diacylglycerol kinase [Bowmanella sp. JS7-9]
MRISMIAAMAHNRVIGKDNQMPWHLPADLKHFKAVTLGKPVIMGRKTYESIGKALPGRLNIVITRDSTYKLDEAVVVNNPEEALTAAGDCEEVMVIGGGNIYQTFLPRCDRLYLTFIDANIDGDTQFPNYQQHYQWTLVNSEQYVADDKNCYNLTFATYSKLTY